MCLNCERVCERCVCLTHNGKKKPERQAGNDRKTAHTYECQHTKHQHPKLLSCTIAVANTNKWIHLGVCMCVYVWVCVGVCSLCYE